MYKNIYYCLFFICSTVDFPLSVTIICDRLIKVVQDLQKIPHFFLKDLVASYLKLPNRQIHFSLDVNFILRVTDIMITHII